MQLRTGSKAHTEQTQSLNTITITCQSTGLIKVLAWGEVKQSKACFPQGKGPGDATRTPMLGDTQGTAQTHQSSGFALLTTSLLPPWLTAV